MSSAETEQQQAEVMPMSAQTGICGGKALISVGGVNVAAENLCANHYAMKYGQTALIPPLVYEP
jgi:hypothetical protein